MNEMVLLESVTLREELCTKSNTEILEKIGHLGTLPYTEYVTTTQLASFYQVPDETIRTLVRRHRKEFKQHGYRVLSRKELTAFQSETLLKTFGYKVLNEKVLTEFQNETLPKEFGIRTKSIAIFPKPAVLLTGCLLRDSEIAKAVRSYLAACEQQLTFDWANRRSINQVTKQLTQHSQQLAQQAAELKEHAEHSIQQSEVTRVIVEEVYNNRERVGQLENTSQEYEKRIKDLEKQLLTLKKPEYINQEQIELLKEKVRHKGHPNTIWAKLKKKFQVKKYIYLPKKNFKEAINWIENL